MNDITETKIICNKIKKLLDEIDKIENKKAITVIKVEKTVNDMPAGLKNYKFNNTHIFWIKQLRNNFIR